MIRPAEKFDSSGDLDACLERIARGNTFREQAMNEGGNSAVPYVQPLLDAIGLFDHLGIKYALIGGVAAMYYGRARFTEDIDFVVATGHRDLLEKNADVMRQFHFDPTCSWKLYHESGVGIDLWKDEFCDEIVLRARDVQLAGRSVRIADPHDLIAMKLRAGRLQDDYDISEMLRKGGIDESNVRAQVTPDQFFHFLEVKKRTAKQD